MARAEPGRPGTRPAAEQGAEAEAVTVQVAEAVSVRVAEAVTVQMVAEAWRSSGWAPAEARAG